MEIHRPFVGRSYEKKYFLNLLSSLGIPSRRLIFLCGSSGIGKTRLVREVTGYINNCTDYLSLYISLAKSYMTIDSALNDIANQLDSFVCSHKFSRKLKDIVDSIFKSLRIDLSIPFTSLTLSLRSSGNDAFTIFNNLIEKTSITIANAGGGLIFIDELQNFLELASKWSPWGLFKYLSSIQEYTSNGYIKFILVSSDFLLRKRVLENVSGEYIATFYIGELSREQSLELLSYYIRDVSVVDKSIEYSIEVIGGSPSNIIAYASSLKETQSPRRALSSIIASLIDDLYTKLDSISRCYGRDVLDEVKEVMEKLVNEPLYLTELPVTLSKRAIDAIDYLVKQNILQYGNSSYIGIYEWNKPEETGGEGGLDIIAPSSRLYLYTMCKVLGIETSLCKKLHSLISNIED